MGRAQKRGYLNATRAAMRSRVEVPRDELPKLVSACDTACATHGGRMSEVAAQLR